VILIVAVWFLEKHCSIRFVKKLLGALGGHVRVTVPLGAPPLDLPLFETGSKPIFSYDDTQIAYGKASPIMFSNC